MKIKAGEKAPDFTLQNTEGQKITLSNEVGKSNILLLFFPLAYTSTCTQELCTMRDNMKLYSSLDATIYGISVDSFFTLKEFKKSENLNFQLLSDFNKEVSAEYGALYEDFFGMKGVSKRAAFIIDREGDVVYEEILEDAGNLPDFESIREVLSEI